MRQVPEVDFGFSRMTASRQTRAVHDVFANVAPGYDAMNDLMSLGLHRIWKRFAVYLTDLGQGQRVLDVAGGTGDMARLCKSMVGPEGRVVVLDCNQAMLQHGRSMDLEAGVAGAIEYVLADASALPFAKASFDMVVTAFGLRNFTDRAASLKAMHSVLRPGGSLLLLEFSRPDSPLLAGLFRWYCLQVLPVIGSLYLDDADSYRYLGESIHSYPDRHAVSKMLSAAGFSSIRCNLLSGGVVTLHRALKA